jgi:hypothetical protein
MGEGSEERGARRRNIFVSIHLRVIYLLNFVLIYCVHLVSER